MKVGSAYTIIVPKYLFSISRIPHVPKSKPVRYFSTQDTEHKSTVRSFCILVVNISVEAQVPSKRYVHDFWFFAVGTPSYHTHQVARNTRVLYFPAVYGKEIQGRVCNNSHSHRRDARLIFLFFVWCAPEEARAIIKEPDAWKIFDYFSITQQDANESNASGFANSTGGTSQERAQTLRCNKSQYTAPECMGWKELESRFRNTHKRSVVVPYQDKISEATDME